MCHFITLSKTKALDRSTQNTMYEKKKPKQMINMQNLESSSHPPPPQAFSTM